MVLKDGWTIKSGRAYNRDARGICRVATMDERGVGLVSYRCTADAWQRFLMSGEWSAADVAAVELVDAVQLPAVVCSV